MGTTHGCGGGYNLNHFNSKKQQGHYSQPTNNSTHQPTHSPHSPNPSSCSPPTTPRILRPSSYLLPYAMPTSHCQLCFDLIQMHEPALISSLSLLILLFNPSLQYSTLMCQTIFGIWILEHPHT